MKEPAGRIWPAGRSLPMSGLTHLKTIAAILQYTTPRYGVGTQLRLFWLVGNFSCSADWGKGVVSKL